MGGLLVEAGEVGTGDRDRVRSSCAPGERGTCFSPMTVSSIPVDALTFLRFEKCWKR